MIPSNLSGRMMVLSPAATRDEDSIYAHRVFGVRFFVLLSLRTSPQTGVAIPRIIRTGNKP